MSKKNKLRANHSILLTLQNAKPKLLKAIVKESSPTLIKLLCEFIYNILRGNVQLNAGVQKKLRQYKKELRCMVCRKRSLAAKRHILIQRGGGIFLPLVIGSVLSGLTGSLTDKILSK